MNLNLISVAALKEAIRIKEQIEKLEARMNQILAGNSNKASTPGRKGPGKMSAAARARIAAAQRARWAKIKGLSQSKPKATKSTHKPMNPVARKKLSEMMKARWAARKKSS